MTIKKVIATGIIAATLITGIPAVEEMTNTSIVSTTASAATYGSLSLSKIQEYERMWENYDFVVQRDFYPTKSTRAMNRAVQSMLNDVMNAELEEDGYIGRASERTMKQYQSTRGLVSDGKFGNASMAMLISECKALAEAKPSSSSSAFLSFDRAYRYAKTYWNTRNGKYNYYSGQNCANFCSQILEYAGVPATSQWCNGSAAFVYVEDLCAYFQNKYNVAYVSGSPKAGSVKPGDLILTNNGGHVMFVMDVSSSGVIYCSANSNNRDEISVSRSCIFGVLKTSVLFA